MTNWLVSYRVQMFNHQLIISGPYDSETLANQHALDISGYEGVTECFLYSENTDELLDKSLT